MIAQNVEQLYKTIDREKVSIVAVTKTQLPKSVREAVTAGLFLLGENRVQEAVEKSPALADLPVQWHLIGHLQTNKVKQAVSLFSLIQSVDSIKLAAEINRHAGILGKVQDILLQVNVAGEETKSGVEPEQAAELARTMEAMPFLRLCGVMTIAPFYDQPEMTRPVFCQTRKIFEQLRNQVLDPVSFRWLSMGMTQDYLVAVQEGANMIRIGTGIFGSR